MRSFCATTPWILWLILLIPLVCNAKISQVNFFCENDFETCKTGEPDHSIAITDDGKCREWIPAYPEHNFTAIYYETYTDSFMGSKSSDRYTVSSVALLFRCGCEHITNRKGFRTYNQSCHIARLYFPCDRIHSHEAIRNILPLHMNDSTLAYWGIDYDYIQDFALY